jgi:pentapeptide MXKDX repeat protein
LWSRWKIEPRNEVRKPFSREKISAQGNKAASGIVDNQGGIRRFMRQRFRREIQTMTIRTRVALGISAAALSLSLALAPVAFAADDTMSKDGMKKDTMSKDGMKKDTMSKDSMSKDSMAKDSMSKDGMKKDDGMKKN